jgi:hypothetical protein
MFVLAVGPEGGWIAAEVDMFKRAGFLPFNMGDKILRTETAVVGLLSQGREEEEKERKRRREGEKEKERRRRRREDRLRLKASTEETTAASICRGVNGCLSFAQQTWGGWGGGQ